MILKEAYSCDIEQKLLVECYLTNEKVPSSSQDIDDGYQFLDLGNLNRKLRELHKPICEIVKDGMECLKLVQDLLKDYNKKWETDLKLNHL